MTDGMDAAPAVTLDTLFRRAGVRDAHALALADPPDRARFTDGAPRRLTYAEADRAVSAFAARLGVLGLGAGTVVALQLPNTVEGIVAILGTLRAGMVAAPLPLLWRRQEMVAALERVGAKAIVTATRIGACAHAELAMEVAAALFPIRQIAAFGTDLPDGVVPLDDVFAATASDPPPRSGAIAAALCTFDCGADGAFAVPHTHARLIAGGAAVAREAGLAPGAPLISTIPPASFAGLVLTLAQWLAGGGALHLHHGFAADAFAAQAAALEGGALALPGPALPALAGGIPPSNAIVALWRGPLGRAAHTPAANAADAVCADETALVVSRRGDDGLPAPAVVEAAGRIAPTGVVRVGGYRLPRRATDAAIAAVDPAAVVTALPDALLGERLAGRAPGATRIAAELTARGVNPLVAGAFRLRSPPP